MSKSQLRAQSAPWSSCVQIALIDGDKHAVKVECEKYEDGMETPFFVSLIRDDAQALIDDLWHSGYRPTEGSGSAGSLAATEKHLADMRKIAFKQLDMSEK